MNLELRADQRRDGFGSLVLAGLAFAFAFLTSATPIFGADETIIYSSLAPVDDSGPRESKGPEVSTVGTAPYLGPLPDELAKLERVEAVAVTSPHPVKEAPAETVTASEGNPPTAEALAKLAMLQERPPTVQPSVMQKLAPMDVPTGGAPVLTPPGSTSEATVEPETGTETTTPRTSPRSGR